MPAGVYKRKPLSEATKNKIRKKLLGSKGSLQKSINLSKALKGKKKSKEFVENLRKVRTGWKLSEVTKDKIREKLKGNKNSVGHSHSPNQKSIDALVNYTKKNGVWNKGLKGFRAGEKRPGIMPKGKNHWCWIKDRTKLKRISKQGERRTSIYFNWRKEVWKRDNYKCKINNSDCKGKIIAHHILPWRDYPELRYEVSNGITLCEKHHPRKRAEEKRLISFFKNLIK